MLPHFLLFTLFSFLPALHSQIKVKTMLADFESKLSWKKGFSSKGAKGKISQANEKIFEKGYGGKIDYDFEFPNGSIEFWKKLNLNQSVERIGLSVNNDKPIGLFLRLRDAKGETFQWTRSLKPSQANTYQYIDYNLKAGKSNWGGDKNGVIDLPITSLGLLLVSPAAGNGTIYIDAISVPLAQKKTLNKQPAKVESASIPAELALQQLLKKEKKSKAKPTTVRVKAPVTVARRVECPLPPPADMSDAKLPAGVITDWRLKTAWQQETATRGRICLNGLWKFRPAWTTDKGQPTANSSWGYLKVPGGWPCSHRWGHNPYSFIPIAPAGWQEAIGPMDLKRGNWHYRNRKTGQAIPFDKVKDAWYQREFTIPPTWQGREISLRFDTIEQQARVFVNGKAAGSLVWPGGSLSVSKLVKFGTANKLTVRLFTPQIGIGDGPRGIAGDVFVESRTSGPEISDIYPIPSWRNKTISLKLAFSQLDPLQQYYLEGVFKRNGKIEKTIKSGLFRSIDLAANTGSFSWKWQNPVLWDLGNGELYGLELTLKDRNDKIIDASLPISFGFREFYTQGRHFMLNGRKVHFFGDYFREYGRSFANVGPEAVKTFITNFREAGFNLIKFSIYDYNAKLSYYPEEMVRMADKMGVAILFQLPRIYGHKATPAAWREWRRKIKTIVKRWRNHPSIFFWATDQGIGHYIEALNPRNFAGYGRHTPTRTDFWNKVKMGTQVTEDYINNIDGSRLVLHLGGGNIGKVVSVYPYYNFTEIQEQREHPSFWVKNGSKPLFYSEWGIPFHVSFTNCRKNNPYPATKGLPFRRLQPFFCEFSAITQGDSTYHLNPQAKQYAAYLDKIQQEGEGDGRWMYKIIYSDKEKKNLVIEQNYLTTQNERLRQLVPYFRAQEMSGIIPYIPTPFLKKKGAVLSDHWLRQTDWSNLQRPGISPDIGIPGDSYSFPIDLQKKYLKKTSNFHTLKEVFAPQIAFIGGGPESITCQAQNYNSGSTVAKTLVIVNDKRKDDTITCRWRLLKDNRVMEQGTEKVPVKAGDVGRKLITFKAPVLSAATTLTLQADFTNSQGKQFASDSFSIHVIPRQKHKNTKSITLWDKSGKTAVELDALGINYQRVTSAELPDALKGTDLFIIGRETLDLTTPLPDLANYVKAGMNILVMEQNQNTLRYRLGFRTNDPAPRKTWKRSRNHSVFRNIPDNALAFFAGESTMLEAYPEYFSDFPYDMGKEAYVDWHGFRVKHCWKWGNTNAVASAIIEKPHTGNFTPLADCGFDLQFSPLLEFTEGKGIILFCQYDLTSRTAKDPVAQQLLRNVITYLMTTSAPAKKKAACYSETLKSLLDNLNISMNTPTADAADVAIIGPDSPATAKEGPQLFTIGIDGKKLSQLTAKTITTEPKKVSGGGAVHSNEPLLNGLGSSDFYMRGRETIPAIKQTGDELFFAPDGMAAIIPHESTGKKVIAYQLRPDKIDYTNRPHMKLTYLKMMRTLRQLLTNTGVQSESPFLKYLATPVNDKSPSRWLNSYYINRPESDDDPYRYQHW